METDCIPILYGLLKKKSRETGEEAGHSLIHLPESTEATQSRGKADERKRERWYVWGVSCVSDSMLGPVFVWAFHSESSALTSSADCLIYSLCDSG